MSQDVQDLPKGNTEYQAFVTQLNDKEKIEEKIPLCLGFMKGALSREKTPAFRDFWDARALCLELFKRPLPQRLRTVYWAEYTALSEEVKVLKEILDKESAFAEEQISLAIDSLETELEAPYAHETLKIPSVLKEKELFSDAKAKIGQLDQLAVRLTALREEVIKTQLRSRSKNRFFQRLSKLGDQIFPPKKEGITRVSEVFLEEVRGYANGFSLGRPPYVRLKEEIKALQAFAKELPLSSKAFHQARGELSKCWDQVKEAEKVLKEERVAQHEKAKKALEQVTPALDALAKKCEGEEISLNAAQKEIDQLIAQMKGLNIPGPVFKALRQKLVKVLQPLEEKAEAARKTEMEARALLEKQTEEKRAEFVKELDQVVAASEQSLLEPLVEKWEALVNVRKTLSMADARGGLCDVQLASIADHIQEKKWAALLEESPDDLSERIPSFLDERVKEKRKVKENLETLRKTVGGSGLGIEESILFQQTVAEEKMRLDAIETMIEEIEEKLFEVED